MCASQKSELYFVSFFLFQSSYARSKISTKCSGIQNEFVLILALYFRVPMPTSIIWPTLRCKQCQTNANLRQNCFTKVSPRNLGLVFFFRVPMPTTTSIIWQTLQAVNFVNYFFPKFVKMQCHTKILNV